MNRKMTCLAFGSNVATWGQRIVGPFRACSPAGTVDCRSAANRAAETEHSRIRPPGRINRSRRDIDKGRTRADARYVASLLPEEKAVHVIPSVRFRQHSGGPARFDGRQSINENSLVLQKCECILLPRPITDFRKKNWPPNQGMIIPKRNSSSAGLPTIKPGKMPGEFWQNCRYRDPRSVSST